MNLSIKDKQYLYVCVLYHDYTDVTHHGHEAKCHDCTINDEVLRKQIIVVNVS